MWHIKDGQAKDNKEIEFAEDIASFANAEGGVLVIGVSNTPVKIQGIGDDLVDIERKLQYTRRVISERVKYPRDIVSFHQVYVDDGTGSKRLCLVIAIANSSDVVEVRAENNRYSYPIRHETGIDRVDRDKIIMQKFHLKADSFDFIQDFNQFIGQ